MSTKGKVSQERERPVAWPNWRKPKEYPPLDIPLEGWAWEFLRRNREYQKQWNFYVDKTAEFAQAFGPPSKWSPEVKAGIDVWFFHPPVQQGETQRAWRARVIASGAEPIGPLPLATGLAIEWHLEEMFNPAFSWLYIEDMEFRPRFRARSEPIIRYHVGHIEDWGWATARAMWPLPAPQGSALVQIDMARPIKAQLDRAVPLLEAKRDQLVADGLLDPDPDPLKGPKTKEYRNLLRVFDAYRAKEASGEKIGNEQIANEIYKDVEEGGTAVAIAKKYSSAAAFVNKGYLRLLP